MMVRIRRLIEQLMEFDLTPARPVRAGTSGSVSHVLASAKSQTVAVHDCDISTGSRERRSQGSATL